MHLPHPCVRPNGTVPCNTISTQPKQATYPLHPSKTENFPEQMSQQHAKTNTLTPNAKHLWTAKREDLLLEAHTSTQNQNL